MTNQSQAYALLRFGLGINLFMHGLMRFGANWEKFQGWITGLFASSPLPLFLVQIAGHLIPPVEFILGLLLMLGLGTRWALMGASFLFINLIFGMCLLQNWDIVGLQMTYLIISTILLFLSSYNDVSLDRFLKKGKV